MEDNNMSKEDIDKLLKIVETCQLADIDIAIIENYLDSDGVKHEAFRAINNDKSCLTISNDNIPNLGENGIIGLSRINTVLRSRLAYFKDDPSFTIQFQKNSKNEISSLKFSNKNATSTFRCASPGIIKAPKAINEEDHAIICFDKEIVQTLIASSKAMGAKQFSIIGKREGDDFKISFDFSDGQESLIVNTESKVDFLSEESNFRYSYSCNIFFNLVRNIIGNLSKEEKEFPIILGEHGFIKLNVNGHWVSFLPNADLDEGE